MPAGSRAPLLAEDVTGAETLSKIPLSHLHGRSPGEEEEEERQSAHLEELAVLSGVL